MPIKKYKPTTPGRRGMSSLTFEEITTNKPEKSLVVSLKSKGGRNNNGRITTRHQGGGHKRNYRIIDFKRNKDGIPAKVATIEYDPNRSANIALLHYVDGEKRYILAPKGLTVGHAGRFRKGCRHQSGQLPGDEGHAGRYVHPQCRAEAGQGRPAGTFCRMLCTDPGYRG